MPPTPPRPAPPVDVAPSWTNFAGGDSFYSVAIAGNVVYAGGHNRWVNNYCGNNAVCEPNALLVNGVSALDANTGLGLPWWHPQTARGDGTMYLAAFAASTYDGSHPGLALGSDVDLIGGAYHSENALFPGRHHLVETWRADPVRDVRLRRRKQHRHPHLHRRPG